MEVTTFAQKQQLEMGPVGITLSEKGTLMATLPANVEGIFPPLVYLPVMDTSLRISAVKTLTRNCRELSRRRYSVGIGGGVCHRIPGTASITGTDADYYRW